MDLNELREVQGQRLELFRQEVEAEPWKKAHAEAMDCVMFEGTLSIGIMIYESLIAADEKLRGDLLKGNCVFDPKQDENMRLLFRGWMAPCAKAEERIQALTAAGFKVENAEKFRKCYDEARWMLLPAGEAFDDPKMVECRDKAIDDLRAGNVIDS